MNNRCRAKRLPKMAALMLAVVPAAANAAEEQGDSDMQQERALVADAIPDAALLEFLADWDAEDDNWLDAILAEDQSDASADGEEVIPNEK
ncbi:MAG: hypothetical protein ACR2PS_04595 [Pseudomonadales bacterium]